MRSSLSLLALLLIGCGPTRDQQRPPLYKSWGGNSLCDSTAVMDSTGIVAAESGCEAHSSGWKVHRASEEQLRRVVRAFEALPPPGTYGQCAPDYSAQLTLEVPGQPRRSWTYCGTADGHQAQFAEAAAAIEGR